MPQDAPLVRCAPAAELRQDQRLATAPPAPRWLLLEVPGPWGRDALLESRLDRFVARNVAHRARAAGARVMLIRRPGRDIARTDRQWAVADSRPGREATWWGRYTADRELLDVPLDGSAGQRSDAPTYLVCAHGRHDACCAIRGRPVAAALAALHPDRVWECSHTGGDRFAANLVVLPHGFYYGHVSAAVAPELARAYDAGRVDPTWLRGRSSLAAPVQAAQHHARLRLAENGADALAPLGVEQEDAQTWRVRLGHETGDVVVVVRARRSEPPVRLTCSATKPGSVRVFDLVALNQVRGSATKVEGSPVPYIRGE
jgi:hypothetical protein